MKTDKSNSSWLPWFDRGKCRFISDNNNNNNDDNNDDDDDNVYICILSYYNTKAT